MEPLAVLAAVAAQCVAVFALEDTDMAEARTQHRTGMIFPLLLAISRRLAALIPTALMSLVAIAAMLVFAKKAFLMSAAALGVALYDSYRARHKQHPKEAYTEVFEPMHFTEVHFKPAPYSKPYYSKPPHSSFSPYKAAGSSAAAKPTRPSSYDVPLHGTSSYYRQPVSGYSGYAGHAGYAKPFDTYPSPSQSLDHGGLTGQGSADDGSSYEVVDDYKPLGGGPAYVADASEQQESFYPFFPNHLQQGQQDQQEDGAQQALQGGQDLGQQAPQAQLPTPAASVLTPVPSAVLGAVPGGSFAPVQRVHRPQYLGPQGPYGNHRNGNRVGRASTKADAPEEGPRGQRAQP